MVLLCNVSDRRWVVLGKLAMVLLCNDSDRRWVVS